jgi:hypothetical protein
MVSALGDDRAVAVVGLAVVDRDDLQLVLVLGVVREAEEAERVRRRCSTPWTRTLSSSLCR